MVLFLPPVLIVGAVTGAAYKFINKDKKIKEVSELAKKQFAEIKEQSKENLNKAVDELCQQQEGYFKDIEEKITSILLKGYTLEELQQLKLDLEKHIYLIREIDL